MEKIITYFFNTITKLTNEFNQSLLYQFLEWFTQKLQIHFEKNTPNLIPHQWSIYEVVLWQNIWSELNKTRPCIIISQDVLNKWNTIIILPLKSIKITTKFWILSVKIDNKISHLRKQTFCSCFNIKEVSKKRLWQYIWTISNKDIKNIKKSLHIIFWL